MHVSGQVFDLKRFPIDLCFAQQRFDLAHSGVWVVSIDFDGKLTDIVICCNGTVWDIEKAGNLEAEYAGKTV